MKTRSRLDRQFLLLSTGIFITICAALIITLSSDVKYVLIKERQNSLVDLTNRQVETHLPDNIFSSVDRVEIDNDFKRFLHEISNNNVIRLKAYDLSGKIIYSDEPALIGKTFLDNEKLALALGGQIVSKVGETDEDENEYEQGYPQLMEVYVPVIKNNQQVGVVELYYNLQSVNSTIQKMNFFVVGLLIISFTILFLSLYWIFRRSANQLDQANKQQLDSLEKITKLKDDFVFVAAHELRTPATIIKGCLDMIYNGPKTKANKEKYLHKINDTNNELIRLINDLLEVARSDSGKLNIAISSQDIKPLIDNAIEKFKPLTKQNGISLRYESMKMVPKVMTNLEKIEEVLNNFISNAIKYNKPKGVITISHEIKTDTLVTHITDTGLGIRDEDKCRIFERFFRCPNTECNIGGTGLGLFITKELVERMHGRVWFVSEVGKGSTFSFELPLCFC